MSAGLLRRAAKVLLRESAGKTTDGPWTTDDDRATVYAASGQAIIADCLNDEVDDDQDAWNAFYITTLHPPVALALADLLDDAAGVVDSAQALAESLDVEAHEFLTTTSHAVTVARAILREPAGGVA